MAKMNARMMRTKMALEVAAELYTQRMFTMGNVAAISIQPEFAGRADFPESRWASTAILWAV